MIFTLLTSAQSSDVNFPTPLTKIEVSGSIKARDIGDSRLTTHYYAFRGDQGDIFINVVTSNFNGSIDVFTADTQQPLTKMVIYADVAVSETGRLIYLRKSEKLLLRIEGRPPDDRPANYKIKFAGSFVAMNAKEDAVEAPKLESSANGSVNVNSVGTIIETPVKPIEAMPTNSKTQIDRGAVVKKKVEAEAQAVDESDAATPKRAAKIEPERTNKTVVVVEKLPESAVVIKPPPKTAKPKAARRKAKAPVTAAKTEPSVETPDPLANIRLVILFKDGRTLEKRMTEVLKFSVDQGTLTVILKDGHINRYSILDIIKLSIE